MGIMQSTLCKLGRHRWGPTIGDAAGASPYRLCKWCGKVRTLNLRTGLPENQAPHGGFIP
jgi:hypothetical protein